MTDPTVKPTNNITGGTMAFLPLLAAPTFVLSSYAVVVYFFFFYVLLMFGKVSFAIYTSPLLFLLYFNDIYRSSQKLNFYLFTDGTTVICFMLKKTLRVESQHLKLTLNAKKSVIFRP